MKKKRIHLVAIISLFALVMGVFPFGVGAQSLADLKVRAANDCAQLTPRLQRYINDFAAASTEYTNIAAAITVNAQTLPALKASLLGPAQNAMNSGVVMDLTEWCTAMQAAATDAAAQAMYPRLSAEVKLKEVILPLFDKMRRVDDVYGKFKRLGDSYAFLNTMNTDADFVAVRDLAPGGVPLFAREKTDIARAISSMQNSAQSVVATMPVLVFYTTVLTDSADVAAEKLRDLEGDINDSMRRIDSAISDYQRALQGVINILTKAAQDGLAVALFPDPTDITHYGRLFDTYAARSQGITRSLGSRIDSIQRTLQKYLDEELNNASLRYAVGNLPAAVVTALRNKLTNTLDTPPIGANNPAGTHDLITIEADIAVPISYTAALGQLEFYKALNIDDITNVVKSAFDFNKKVGKVSELAGVRTRYMGSVVVLIDALDVSGNGAVNAVDGLREAEYAPILTALNTAFPPLGVAPGNIAALSGADKVLVEGHLTAFDSDNLKNSLKAYSMKLNETIRVVNDLRKQWWGLIRSGAKEGLIDINAPVNATLKAEEIASRLFEDFDRKREDYNRRAESIVTGRQDAIRDNKITLSTLTAIPAAQKAAVNLSVRSDTKITDLTNKLNTIQGLQNYGELVDEVRSIRDMGINNVFIPLQKMYIRFDIYYQKQTVLKQIRDILDVGIVALPAGTPEETAIKNALVNSSATINTELTDLLADLNTALSVEMLAIFPLAPVPDGVTALKNLQTTERGIKASLSSIQSQLNDLRREYKDAL